VLRRIEQLSDDLTIYFENGSGQEVHENLVVGNVVDSSLLVDRKYHIPAGMGEKVKAIRIDSIWDPAAGMKYLVAYNVPILYNMLGDTAQLSPLADKTKGLVNALNPLFEDIGDATAWKPTGEKFNGHTVYHKYFTANLGELAPSEGSTLTLFTIEGEIIEFFEARGRWYDGGGFIPIGQGGLGDGYEFRSNSSLTLTNGNSLIFRSVSTVGRISANNTMGMEARIALASGNVPI
jgi:hypothetical protein